MVKNKKSKKISNKDGKKETSSKKKKFSLSLVYDWIKNHAFYTAIIAAVLIIIVVIVVRVFNARRSALDEYQVYNVTRGDLVAIVGATGVVEPNQSVELDWETTGRVEEVCALVNDQVEKDDVLAVLADNSLPQSVILAKADLVTAQKELDDLLMSDTQRSQAYVDLLDAEEEFKNAEDDRDYWNFRNTDMDRIYGAREEFLAAEETFKKIETALQALETAPDDDPDKAEALEKFEEARLARDKALRNLNYLLGAAYDQEVAEDFANFELALAELEDAQREWERVQNGPNQSDIESAEAKVAAAEATVALGAIEAPFSGTVTIAEPKVGDFVVSGTKGYRVDDLTNLYVEVEISEVDINRISIGQEAQLFFDAVLGVAYNGEVVEVASVGTDDGSGTDFIVRLRILDPDEKIRPGMTAAVNIIVSEVKSVLYVPNRAIRNRAGKQGVYVLRDGELEYVEVKLGSSSDVNSEVISDDLIEGDQVVMNPPQELITNGGPPGFVR